MEAPVKRLEKSSRSIADEREVSRGGDPSVTGEGRFAPKSAGIFPNPGGTTDRTVRPEPFGSGRFCLGVWEMEFRFELSDGYSLQELVALNKLYVKKSKIRRWTTPLFRLLFILVGVSFILSSLSWLDGGYVGETPVWQLVAVPLVIGLLWLFLGLFYFRISAWKSRRMMLKNTGSFLFVLDDEGVTEQTSKGVAHFHYNSFQEAYDDQKRWFLFLDKRYAFILPKEAMTMGNPEMFVDFWKSKSGKDMIKIKSRRLHR